jgi:iron complex outermembrane receptor protein
MGRRSVWLNGAGGGLASALAVLSAAPMAHAQGTAGSPPARPAAAAQATTVDTVIVTATRRKVDVQKLPIAIDAYDGKQIRDRRIESVADLQFLSPGLKVSGGNSERVTLRGIGPNSINPIVESGVGTYLDGVFLGSATDQSQPLYDLERIEILRGPQGALYGRDATVGAINYVTQAPTNSFHAGVDLTGGSYGLVQTDGYVSGPLAGDALTGRLAFRTEDHAGYTPNHDGGRALDAAHNWELRGRLTYKPTDTLKIDLTADYAHDDDTFALIAHRADASLPSFYEAFGAAAYNASPMPSGRAVDQNDSEPGGYQTGGVSAKLSWNAGFATLTSLTAYRETRLDQPSGDLDFTSAPLLNLHNKFDFQQVTQDLYLASPDSGRFSWTLGASYFGQQVRTSELLSFSPALGGGFEFLQSPKLRDDAFAVYGEATYRILDNLALTGGVRYSNESKSKSEADECGSISCFGQGGFTPFSVSHAWTEWTPHASLSYEPSKTLTVYFSVGQGFKAGGFNALTPQSTPYNPEVSTNYELGLKSESFDRRLLLNFALFHMDYDNLQVEQRVAVPTEHLEVLNAAKARVNGVEAQFVVRPVEAFQLDGNLAFLDAKYLSFPKAIVDFQPAAGPPATLDASGNRLSGAPRWSGNVGVQYTWAVSDFGRLTLRGEHSFQSDVYFTASNSPLFRQPGYNWFNARLTFETSDKHLSLALWAKNISNQAVYGYLAPGGPHVPGFSDVVFGVASPPRTYGVTLGYRY